MPFPVRPAILLPAVIGAVLAATPVAATSAAEGRWVRQHYGSAHGLPVSSATSARIDDDGFLWLATHDGLARFDGQRFDVHDSMRFPAMSGNRVLSIHEDPQGRLFAHTAHGDWLSIRSGNIRRAPMGIDSAQGVRHVDPASLCLTTAQALHCPDGSGAFPLRVRFPDGVDPALGLPAAGDRGSVGTVWLIASDGELWRHRHGAWHSILRTPPSSGASFPASAALVASDGTLWAGNQGRLLHAPSEGAATYLEGAGDPQMVLQLRQDRQGVVWVGAMNGLYRIDADGGAAWPQRVLAGDRQAGGSTYLSWQAPDDALWVRVGQRLWRFDALPGGHAPATPVLAAPPVLVSKGQVLDLLFDAEGTVWVMTLRDGIHRLNRARVTLLDDAAGMGDGNVYGVSHGHDGTMWLGTLGDGLKAIARDGTPQRHGRRDGLPGDNPWLVAAGPDGGIHVATYAPGLWHRAPGSTRFQAVALPDALHGEQVLAIVFDPAQRMWLGTTAGAWRRDAGTWTRQWPDGLQRRRVSALAFSASGEAWFGGGQGVWRQHGDSGHAVAETLLSRTSVRDLYRSSDRALWISTDGRGLVRVDAGDPQGKHAVSLGRAQGLPSNSPHAVREDRNGHLWVNSNQGIFRIARDNLRAHLGDLGRRLSPLVLGLSDGLTELEGNGGVQPAAAFDAEGRLWFPSQRGVVRFDPLDMPLREQPPRAVIDGLESEGQRLRLDADQALPIGLRSLLIRYGAADLHGAQVRFRYRLLPQDQGWTDALNGRAASFASLSPGDYRFELLAGNSDGIWADTPTAFDFRVPNHWYETGAFRLLLAVAGALLLLAATRLRMHSLQRRAVELDHQVGERTGELRTEKRRVESALSELSETHAELARTHAQVEDRNQQLAEQARRLEALDRFRSRVLADVSHELRTPVMLVSLPLRELHAHSGSLGETERRRLQLSLTQLDRLGGLVEQLVGLVQAESGQLRLRLRRIDLGALLAELVAGYQPAAARSGVTLLLHADAVDTAQTIVLFADRDHLLTVFGNLVDNAIKYAPAGSAVDVRVAGDGENARVEVQDHGPGFDPALAAQLFERFYRVEGPPRSGREGLGIGLALARELVELHGGRIGARSAPGAGATFHVELPLGSAHIALDEVAVDGSPGHPPSLAATGYNSGEGRVLLVEDHPDLAVYLAERLGEHLPVTCVDSAESALQALAGDADIRLLISDVVLPGISGLELCQRVQAGADAPPVILISAKAAEGDRVAGLDAGAVTYLAKPFSFEAMLQAVAAAWPAAAPRLSAQPADAAHADPLLQIALNALADAGFGIPRWADRAHLSERQLRRRVNELTGQSPQTWLREQRLLRVRHLIRSGDCRTLAEAGARCGLDNAAYLYRSYRARFGEH